MLFQRLRIITTLGEKLVVFRVSHSSLRVSIISVRTVGGYLPIYVLQVRWTRSSSVCSLPHATTYFEHIQIFRADGNIEMASWPVDCFPSLPQVRGHNLKPCARRVRCQGWGDWMAAAGELTSNMKVKWQAGHNKVSIGVSPFQTSQEQSGRKRPSQLLADVSGRMFHWQTRGRRRSLMVPLVTSNLHLAGRESCNTPVRDSVWDLKQPVQLTSAHRQNIMTNLSSDINDDNQRYFPKVQVFLFFLQACSILWNGLCWFFKA